MDGTVWQDLLALLAGAIVTALIAWLRVVSDRLDDRHQAHDRPPDTGSPPNRDRDHLT